MTNKKTCFITGANGKIGKKLVLKLLEKNFKVVALVRDKTKLPIRHSNLEILQADILESQKYKTKLRGCDFVFHLAVYQNISDPDKNNFINVNVKGIKTVFESSIKAKIKKIIYLSTIMIFDSVPNKLITENSPKKNPDNKNFYVDTKIQALEIVEQYKKKIPIITIYPTIVIDPDEIFNEVNKPTGIPGFIWNLLGGGVPGGIMSMIGNKKRIINYILIDNLIEGIVNCLKLNKTNDNFILGGENISVEKYRRQILQIKQKPLLPIRIPIGILKILKLLNLPKLKLTDNIIENISTDMKVSSQKAQKILDLKINKLKDLKHNASLLN